MKDRATPDDQVTCGICGHETSIAMIGVHLANEHDVDLSEIKNAPIVDLTEGREMSNLPDEEMTARNDTTNVYEAQVESIARAFHDSYEKQADEHGWKPQDKTRVAWEDLPEQNRSLMIAVVRELLRDGVIAVGYLNTAGGD
jgi:hypothetical protein